MPCSTLLLTRRLIVSPLGEAAEFYAFMLAHWGEDGEQDMEWEGDTVTLHADCVDYLIDPMHHALMVAVPVSMTVRRNEPR